LIYETKIQNLKNMAISTSKLITIDRFIAEEQDQHPDATGEFSFLLSDFSFAIKLINKEIRRAGLNDLLGMTDKINTSGDHLRKLDDYAFEVIYRTMDRGGNICVMASEESDEIMLLPPGRKKGKYVFIFDPMDGSTNIDVNHTVGTIFSLYMRIDPSLDTDGTIEDVLQPGYLQKAAGYVLYGSSTIFAYTTGHGVNVFTYDPTIGEFLLTFSNLKIPPRGNYYSCNEGYYYRWEKNFRDYVRYLKTPSEDNERPYIMRYVATAAADIHRILHYGGIYMFPADSVLPNGKIRLVYEANPLAFIVEQAGGKASTGTQRILDLKPESIHQRIPFFVGSELDILDLEKFLRGEGVKF